jgi:hypothetical protein
MAFSGRRNSFLLQLAIVMLSSGDWSRRKRIPFAIAIAFSVFFAYSLTSPQIGME